MKNSKTNKIARNPAPPTLKSELTPGSHSLPKTSAKMKQGYAMRGARKSLGIKKKDRC